MPRIGEPLMRFPDPDADWRFHLGCGDVVEAPGAPGVTATSCPLHGTQQVIKVAPMKAEQ